MWIKKFKLNFSISRIFCIVFALCANFVCGVVVAEVRQIKEVKPIELFQMGVNAKYGNGLFFLEPNTPCALIATSRNSGAYINYTYHNPRGIKHPNYGWGCLFDMYYLTNYGYPAGTVRVNSYKQNWIGTTLTCPAGYTLNYTKTKCTLVTPTSDPLCYKNPILLGDGAKFQMLNFGGVFDNAGFRLTYRSNPYFGPGAKYRSMYGRMNWSDSSSARLLFSKVIDGRSNVFFYDRSSALYVFEIESGGVIAQNVAHIQLIKAGSEWVLRNYESQLQMRFDESGALNVNATRKLTHFRC
jgi:hypothetical protein